MLFSQVFKLISYITAGAVLSIRIYYKVLQTESDGPESPDTDPHDIDAGKIG